MGRLVFGSSDEGIIDDSRTPSLHYFDNYDNECGIRSARPPKFQHDVKVNQSNDIIMFKTIIYSLALLLSVPAWAAAPMKLWRLECGQFETNASTFDDKATKPGPRKMFSNGCYLIRHGKNLMLWDAGFGTGLLGARISHTAPVSPTLRLSLVRQLKQLGFAPDNVTIMGLSHYHSDHMGQAASFPHARLMIGKADAEAMRHEPYPFFVDPKPVEHWLSEGGVLDEIEGDRDVFGDGSVTMIALPGHSPGNHGLLVRLPKSGVVLLSGDAEHFTGQAAEGAVPPVNSDRAATIASYHRIDQLLAETHGRLIIQHEPADIAELPAFPAYAQ